ncbi:P-loop containing nucleoside triphosphate hydrolase protein [Wilcoxina mikolae CBS 423.85]|nr:P-loop containing nucleoside triphosphate hydrolase protein [Wilcoxina mikolae CBS 423.85]
MERDEPPDGNFLLLLPATIHGFNVQENKMGTVKLMVDRILPIEWNKQAFEGLVMEPRTKELVKALVSVHTEAQQNAMAQPSADLMAGKGNGPGTGKTLNAESVAELAQKPLYRKYLETILFLGRTWDCAVLLDEADVFLEERTLLDLQRNALVSVFLRVLEYYEGILILTSNCVGTFDEAFKSRIQLAIHYPPLGEEQRKKIWKIFFKILYDNGVNARFHNLEKHLDQLAEYNMNGRQIRNAVTTARQLAKNRRETLDYCHLDQVIQTADEFEKYLLLTHGYTDEQMAQDEGIRH